MKTAVTPNLTLHGRIRVSAARATLARMKGEATATYDAGRVTIEIHTSGVLIGRWAVRAARVSDVQRVMVDEGWRVQLRKTMSGGAVWRGEAVRPDDWAKHL